MIMPKRRAGESEAAFAKRVAEWKKNPGADHVEDMVYRRDASIAIGAPTSFDPATRECDIVISTGMAVRRRDWDGEYDEVLDMSPGSIRLGRLNAGAALIDSHQWYMGIDAMLGGLVPNTARIEGGKLVARARFSRGSERAVRVARDIQDGIQYPASAGYKVHRFNQDDSYSPPRRTIVDWEPFEVSLVTVAAEMEGTGIRQAGNGRNDDPRRTAANQENEMQKPVRRAGESDADFTKRVAEFMKAHPVTGETDEGFNKRVADYITAAAAKARAEDDADDDEDAKKKKEAEAAAAKEEAERKRLAASSDATRGAEQPKHATLKDVLAIGRQAKMPLETIEKTFGDGCTVEEFRSRAFDFLSTKSDGGPSGVHAGGSDGGGEGGGSYGETSASLNPLTGRDAAMAEAMAIRMLSTRRIPAIVSAEQKAWAEMRGIEDNVMLSWRIFDGKEKPKNAQVRDYLGKSIVEMAAEFIGYKGRGLLTNQRAADILKAAFETRGGMHSTSDFPSIFENALNKSLLGRYVLQMPTYRQIGVERPFQDFRAHLMVRAGDAPMLQPLTETGELRAGTSQESKESVSVKPYGVIFPISRQMMVNDEMGAIDQILADMGNQVLVFENTTFFTMFLSASLAGPTLLQDGLPVFTYGAIAAPGAAPVGHNNFADTHAHGGDPPNVATISAARQALRGMKSLGGNYLNIPPAIMVTGPVQETAADQMVTSITPALVGSVNPFSGKLRNVTAAEITGNDWYVCAEPSQLPCFVYGFLNGMGGPRTRTDEPFGVQGLRVSLEHDFGCGAIDYRGFYRNSGLIA
jgi:hypothetical protein